MGVINFLANIMPTVNVPKLDGFVGNFLKVLNGGIGSICVTMIVFTLIVKLLTAPLDFISRRTSKNNQIIQERLKPQLDKIDKQFGDDKRTAQGKKQMLMKKSGYKTVGACLPALVTIVLVIYIFTAVNSFTTFTMAENYNTMAEHYSELVLDENGDYDKLYYDEAVHTLTKAGEEKMIEKFEELNPSFLWIKNPWRPDAWQSAVSSYNDFKSGGIGIAALRIDDEFAEDQYNQIMGSIAKSDKYKGWNGFMILPILAAAVSLLSQLIMSKTQPQQAPGQSQATMKVMKFISPLMTLYFGFMYTSAFAIYMLFNSLLTIGFTLLIGKIVGKGAKRKEAEFTGQQSYRRK